MISKRSVALTLLMCLITACLCPSIAAYADSVLLTYDFGTGTGTGITAYTNSAEKVTKGGRAALLLDPASEKKLYASVNVDDKIMYNIPDYTPVEVTVEYYDEGKGFFEVAYDGYRLPKLLNGDVFHLEGRNNVWCHTDNVTLTDTKQWKTVKFCLENMRFSNRGDNFDLRIGVWTMHQGTSPSAVPIGSVRIEKLTTVSDPLRLVSTGDVPGMIFGDDVNLKMSYLNISEKPLASHFTATVTDEKSAVVWTKEWDANFASRETKVFSLSPKLTKYGIYNLNIVADSVYSGSSVANTSNYTDTAFSMAYGLNSNKNSYMGTALTISRYSWSERGVSPKIAAAGGMTWNREEIRWQDVEKEKGKYEIPAEMWQDLVDAKNAGLSTQLLLNYGNPLYSDNVMIPPNTPEYIAKYAEWCKWMARTTKGYVDAFAVWNEYNIEIFNPTDVSDDNYVEMLKAVYTAIKSPDGNPDAIVIGFESASFDFDYFDNVIKAGGLNYMDVVGVHHYFLSPELLQYCSTLLKQKLAAAGKPDMPIWWTEFGDSMYDYTDTFHSTTEESANIIVRNYALMRGFDWADKALQFRLHDTVENISRIEGAFGLVNDYRSSYAPSGAKPAYLAVSAMNKLIGSNAGVKKAEITNNKGFVIRFYNRDLKCDVFAIGDMEDN